ncbi:hypothetical protein [Burkholderia sp. AW49-1]
MAKEGLTYNETGMSKNLGAGLADGPQGAQPLGGMQEEAADCLRVTRT